MSTATANARALPATGFPVLTGRTIANLDTLRVVAVAAVLAHHLAGTLILKHILPASLALGGLGQAGVLAFFMHTSLVLMFSLERLPKEGRTLAFYIRRIFRIYPLAMVCIVVVVASGIPAVPMGTFARPPAMLLAANLLLVQNIIGHASVSSPLWSLPFEVQVYAVLPWLCRLCSLRRATTYLGLLIAAFSIAGWIVQYRVGHASMLAYVPCFLSGVLAYVLRYRKPFLPASGWPAFVVLWMVLAGCSGKTTAVVYLPLTWVATLLLAVSVSMFRECTNRSWNKGMETIAKYSYGIYLSHFPVMWLAFRVIPVKSLAAQIVIWVAGTAIVSVVSYHLLEKPMIDASRPASKWLLRTLRGKRARVGDIQRTPEAINSRIFA